MYIRTGAGSRWQRRAKVDWLGPGGARSPMRTTRREETLTARQHGERQFPPYHGHQCTARSAARPLVLDCARPIIGKLSPTKISNVSPQIISRSRTTWPARKSDFTRASPRARTFLILISGSSSSERATITQPPPLSRTRHTPCLLMLLYTVLLLREFALSRRVGSCSAAAHPRARLEAIYYGDGFHGTAASCFCAFLCRRSRECISRVIAYISAY